MNAIEQPTRPRPRTKAAASLLALLVLVCSGCGTPDAVTDATPPASTLPAGGTPVQGTESPHDDPAAPVILEGFEVNIAFLGAPNLSTKVRVRPDGKVTLPLIGELEVVGLTPVELEERLKELYASELISTEMVVTLTSAAFPVYINGAVGRSGEIMCDRPTTVFELVMRAGVDMTRANLRSVLVIRREDDQPKRYVMNLELVLDGKDSGLFFLKPGDTVYVPIRVI